jgi:hypothetical protein
MSAFRLSLLALAVLCAAVRAQAPVTAEVEGKITFQGKPLTSGKLEFHPPKGKEVTADIRQDSTYLAKKVPLGEMIVVVKVKGLPAQYESPKTSPLRVEVKKGKQVFDIELK